MRTFKLEFVLALGLDGRRVHAVAQAWRMALLSAFLFACKSVSAPSYYGQPGPPVRIVLSPPALTLLPGEEVVLAAAAVDSSGRATVARVVWTTSDSTVARVDPENGSLTSVSPGTATITASVDELRASSLVTVIELAGTIAFARQEGNWPGAVITYRAGFRRAVLTEPSGLFLAEPDWSPDGSALVVQASTRLPGDNSQSDIFIVRADKLRGPDDWHQLTRDRQSRSATWSPDGKRIAYVSGPVSGADIHMIEIAGGAPVRLTQQPGLYLGPRWSPDGRRIAFIEFRPDETSDIYVVNVDGGGREKVSQDGAYNYGSPSWSPDGKHLAFLGCRDGGCGLDVLDLGSRALRRLIAYGAPGDWVAGSTWSPDGRQILYSLTTWSGGRNADGRSGVYIMNADGSGATQLTRPPAGAFDGQPTWRR